MQYVGRVKDRNEADAVMSDLTRDKYGHKNIPSYNEVMQENG